MKFSTIIHCVAYTSLVLLLIFTSYMYVDTLTELDKLQQATDKIVRIYGISRDSGIIIADMYDASAAGSQDYDFYGNFDRYKTKLAEMDTLQMEVNALYPQTFIETN